MVIPQGRRCTVQQPAETVLNVSAAPTGGTFVPSQVLLDWSLNVDGSSGTEQMGHLHGIWVYPLEFRWTQARDAGGTITLRVRAVDQAGRQAVSAPLTVTLVACNLESNQPPVIRWMTDPGTLGLVLRQDSPNCQAPPNSTQVLSASVEVSDDRDQYLDVRVHWSGFASGSFVMQPDGRWWYGQVGPIPYTSPNGGTLKVWVTATDSAGATAILDGTPVTVIPCVGQ